MIVDAGAGLMSTRKIDADEALRLGLVDRVVPADALLATVYACARDLANNVSPRAMAVIKRQVWPPHACAARASGWSCRALSSRRMPPGKAGLADEHAACPGALRRWNTRPSRVSSRHAGNGDAQIV